MIGTENSYMLLHSICQQIWKTQQWPWDWKRSVFIPLPKKGNAKECPNYRTIAFISHASNKERIFTCLKLWSHGSISNYKGKHISLQVKKTAGPCLNKMIWLRLPDTMSLLMRCNRIKASGTNLAHHLFLYSPWAKTAFHIFNCWGEKSQRSNSIP